MNSTSSIIHHLITTHKCKVLVKRLTSLNLRELNLHIRLLAIYEINIREFLMGPFVQVGGAVQNLLEQVSLVLILSHLML